MIMFLATLGRKVPILVRGVKGAMHSTGVCRNDSERSRDLEVLIDTGDQECGHTGCDRKDL